MRILVIVGFVWALAACGGDGDSPTPAVATPLLLHDVAVAGAAHGVTPFIMTVQLMGASLPLVQSVSYTIQPKPGSASQAVNVTYSIDALTRSQGNALLGPTLVLPVFGLYSGYTNNVSIQLSYLDGSLQTIAAVLETEPYADPNAIYDRPVIKVARTPGSALGFDFFAMKSNLGTPIIVDTDGNIRWVGTGLSSGFSSIYTDNGFVIGDPNKTTVYRLELDGTFSTHPFTAQHYTTFNHNIDPGRGGALIAEVNSATNVMSTYAELSVADGFGKQWDFAQILSDYMTSQGDDPSNFVRPGADWFHSNASTYDPSDDTLIVSSRENFIMKVDYNTGNIIWILGDPTKYWYTFPSLKAKALTLTPGGIYPIGQHATSITSEGLVMVMNDGLASLNEPTGTSPGGARSYTAVSAYSIDAANHAATEMLEFDYGQSIYSAVCSSVYEAFHASLLLDYAVADADTHTRLVGLDSQQNVIFDFQYANDASCNTSWNAVPVHFEEMMFL